MWKKNDIVYRKANAGKVGEVGIELANFRTDRNGNPYGLKKCKYHCDYGDGEYCHYKEIDGCIYNKTKEEIDGQIKGRRMTDAESVNVDAFAEDI